MCYPAIFLFVLVFTPHGPRPTVEHSQGYFLQFSWCLIPVSSPFYLADSVTCTNLRIKGEERQRASKAYPWTYLISLILLFLLVLAALRPTMDMSCLETGSLFLLSEHFPSRSRLSMRASNISCTSILKSILIHSDRTFLCQCSAAHIHHRRASPSLATTRSQVRSTTA